MQVEAPGMPSEAALVRQPSVAAAVHQALPDMPVPPLTLPLSSTSSESKDLPEGLLLQSSQLLFTPHSLVDITDFQPVPASISASLAVRISPNICIQPLHRVAATAPAAL